MILGEPGHAGRLQQRARIQVAGRAQARALALGGRLIMPVGPEGQQELIRFTKREQKIDRVSLGPVSFVPLLGGVG